MHNSIQARRIQTKRLNLDARHGSKRQTYDGTNFGKIEFTCRQQKRYCSIDGAERNIRPVAISGVDTDSTLSQTIMTDRRKHKITQTGLSETPHYRHGVDPSAIRIVIGSSTSKLNKPLGWNCPALTQESTRPPLRVTDLLISRISPTFLLYIFNASQMEYMSRCNRISFRQTHWRRGLISITPGKRERKKCFPKLL